MKNFWLQCLEHKCLRYVKKMVIWRDVFFNKSIFNMLSEYTNLHELEIHEGISLKKSELQSLKEKMPVCDIIYGDKKIS